MKHGFEQALSAAVEQHRAGNVSAAIRTYRTVLVQEPSQVTALYLSGVIADQQGELSLAVRLLLRAITLRGGDPVLLTNLGTVLAKIGNLPRARQCWRGAIVSAPIFAAALQNIALIDHRERRSPLTWMLRLIRIDPQYTSPRVDLAAVLRDSGQLEQSFAEQRKILLLDPSHSAAITDFASLALDRGDLAAASLWYQRAITLAPHQAQAWSNLGLVHQRKKDWGAAQAKIKIAMMLQPEASIAISNLALTLLEQGFQAMAQSWYRRGAQLQPGLVELRTSKIFAHLYDVNSSWVDGWREAVAFDRQFAVPLTVKWPESVLARSRPRIGFVSGDLRSHAVAHLILPTIEALSQQGWDLSLYSNAVATDDITERFKASAQRWRTIHKMPDRLVAEQIRADQIDILFDLSGYSGNNRLLLFALKPAPIQISWVGYPGTTGLSAIDYMIADQWQLPPEAEQFFTEKIIRMPSSYIAFGPPLDTPPLGPLPAMAAGAITFGSFNVLQKISVETVALWSDILKQVENSRLLMKAPALSSKESIQHYRQLFFGFGIHPDRLTLLGASSPRHHRAAMELVDIALDSFPYSGGLTTLEALWMGLPVITCPGQTFASRHSFGYLKAIGADDLIAADLGDYRRIATDLARDWDRVTQFRSNIRSQMLNSPLCDVQGFAHSFGAALQEKWDLYKKNDPGNLTDEKCS